MKPLLPAEQAGVLSREIVRIAVEYTGRGPTRVRATLGQDVICVVLHDNHTKGERALLAIGEHALVSQLRRAYHRAMQPALIEAARSVTGRDFLVVLADHSTDPDVSTLNFVLASPATAPAPVPVMRPSTAARINGSATPALI